MVSYNASTQWTRARGTLLLAVSLEPKEIGQRIAAARQRKGWTQLAFALAANVSPSTTQRWESGALPPVRELMRIADLLEIEPEELVEVAPTEAGELASLREELGEVRALVEQLLERSA